MRRPFELQKTTLKSGLKVVTARKPDVPLFYSALVLNAGSIYDPPGKNGVAELVSRFLEKDTLHFTREEIASFIEGLGGSLEADSGHYTQQIKLNILSKFAHHGLKMMAEMAANPVFDRDEFKIETRKLISEHTEALGMPFEVLDMAFNMRLYRRHPLGVPSSGVVETVRQIKLQDLIDFHRNYFRPSNALLVAVSDLPHGEVVRMVEDAFSVWDNPGEPIFPQLPDVQPIEGREAVIVNMPTTQAFILLGHHAPLRNSPDFPKLHVLNFAIGGGVLSRMMRIIRIERGLAYGTQSVFKGGLKFPGAFVARTETKLTTGNEAIRLVMEILRDVHENGITERELEAAKSFYQGAIPRMAESHRQIASLIVNSELFGLPDYYWLSEIDAISKLSLDDVREAARKYIHPENFVLTVVADALKFKLQLEGLTHENIRQIEPDILKSLNLLEA